MDRSYWKLVSVGFLDTTNVVTGDRSDHFGWPGSPGNTGRDDCGNRPAKGRNLKKGKKAVQGPFIDDAIAVCQESDNWLWVSHAFQKDFGIEQDCF